MTNRSKQKGTAFEVLCRNYLRQWWPIERLAQEGSKDRGDLFGIPGVVIECKAAKRFALSEWMNELATEKKNAGMSVGFVALKRPNHNVSNAYAIMELKDMVEILQRLDLQVTGGATGTTGDDLWA